MKFEMRTVIILTVCLVAVFVVLTFYFIAQLEGKDTTNSYVSSMPVPKEILIKAQEHLSKKDSSKQFVLHLNETREYEFGWVFFYTTKRFIETENPDYLVPGSGPFVVARTGDTVDLSSSMPPEDAIEAYRLSWKESR